MSADRRVEELGPCFPSPRPPSGTTSAPSSTTGSCTSRGTDPFATATYGYRGKVDSVVSVESAREAAELTMINALGTVRATLGTLDRVTRVVKLLGMVNSDPDFAAQPKVIDAASDLLVEIFGENGRHARSAVGLGALPMEISVEIEMVLAIR